MTGPRSSRRTAFATLTALLVLGGVEAGSWAIERAENAVAHRRNPFVEAINPAPAFEVVEVDGRKMVQRTGFHPLMISGPPFPLEKPAGGLRVFVLGGSAAAGWPYHTGETSLSALLRRKLEQLYPGRPVEVVNMAAGTYASHRVLLLLEEALRYGPDAVFVYNGNNEFLEDLVYRPVRPPAPWDRSAAARLAWRAAVSLTTERPRFDVRNYDIRDQTGNALSFAFSKASRYHEDPRQFEALLEHYRFNMASMAEDAADARVPLFFVTCPVNLKDWSPNVSHHTPGLPEAARARWQAAFREGTLALERGDPAAAVAPLRAALEADPEYAEVHFLLGRALLALGRTAEAHPELLLALEDDAFPFRELPELQAALREVAARRGVPLVDVIPALEAASGGIPGLEVFVDYVHLNERGQEIVAQRMLEALQQRGLLPGRGAAEVAAQRMAIQHEFSPERDTYALDVSYNMALVMHQYWRLDDLYAQLVETFQRAARERPADAAAYLDRLGTFRVIQVVATRYRDLMRASRLGLVDQLYGPGEAEQVYQTYVELIYQLKGSSLDRQAFQRLVPAEPYAP